MNDTTKAGASAGAKPPVEEPPNAMVHVPPAAAPEPEPEVPAEPSVDFDMDEGGNTLRIKLGGRLFIARENTIAQRKEILTEAQKANQAEGEEEVDEDASFDVVLASINSLSSIYPQIAEVLEYADGAEQGLPPSREFVERHVRVSAYGRLFRQLHSAEGKD